ncbi:unnamed protein product [Heligmosomoides polygyrus]|uniref:Inner membrane protein n=1 Tax=Heligmosomoides polygyrus TaxID=6339 RepID=A0A183F6R2_HELPZ|nr:unnamed protein product [Heligmosomoides polygyrus]
MRDKVFKGHDWIADDLISLHHLNPNEIRIYDDLIYRMRSPQLSMAKNSVNNVSSEKENGEPNSIPTPSPFLQLKSWKVDNSRKGS